MNIYHVITRLIVGGAQENTVLTCRGLVEKGHRVTLVSGPETGPEGSLWKQAESAGCDLVKLDSLRRNVQPFRDWRALRELRDLFARTEPHVVHTHSSKAGILGRYAAANAGVPIIVHTIHGMSFNRTQPPYVRLPYRWLEQRAARHTTALVTVADAMTDQAVAAGVAPRDRFTTVYSGMETERYEATGDRRSRARAEWGGAKDEIVVGTIARLFDNKGYDEILDVMPEVIQGEPRLKFVWIGDGTRRGDYERRLSRMGLRDRVHLTGLVSPEQVASLIPGFDIVLHASRWEGLPRAIVQGLLAGVPAISFDNDGAPEVVIDGKTGLLVPLGDREGLRSAIISLAQDPGLRDRLGAAGRSQCLARFGWRRMVDQLDELYRRLAKDRDLPV